MLDGDPRFSFAVTFPLLSVFAPEFLDVIIT